MFLSWIKNQWQHSKQHPSWRMFWAKLYRLVGHNHTVVKGVGDTIEMHDAILHNVFFDIIGNNNRIFIGSGARLANTLIRLRGHYQNVEIGERCTYQGGQLWLEEDRASLKIGAGTTVVEAQISVTEPGSRIEIGSECMLAHDIDIRCGDSHSIIDLDTGDRINHARNITIGQHVWIAAGATILKGVDIGPNSVVANHAVVTRSFPAYCLIGGFPASVLREKITWTRERIPSPQKEADT